MFSDTGVRIFNIQFYVNNVFWRDVNDIELNFDWKMTHLLQYIFTNFSAFFSDIIKKMTKLFLIIGNSYINMQWHALMQMICPWLKYVIQIGYTSLHVLLDLVVVNIFNNIKIHLYFSGSVASSHKFILDDGGYYKLDSRTFIVNGRHFLFSLHRHADFIWIYQCHFKLSYNKYIKLNKPLFLCL